MSQNPSSSQERFMAWFQRGVDQMAVVENSLCSKHDRFETGDDEEYKR